MDEAHIRAVLEAHRNHYGFGTVEDNAASFCTTRATGHMWGFNDLNRVAKAAQEQDWGTVRAALRRGMPPDSSLFPLSMEPWDRSVSIFHWVVGHNQVKLAAEFVAAGADVHAPPGTRYGTPLHIAASIGNVAMLKTLKAQNYVHGPTGMYSGNLLHALAHYGRLEALEWVFAAAPDAHSALFVADYAGCLPVDRCRERDGSIRFPACAAFLRARMRWSSLRAVWVQAVVAVGLGK
jgi:hypothetical protein